MKTVFLDYQTFSKDSDLTSLQQVVDDLTVYATTSPEQVIPRCQNAEVVLSNKVLLNRGNTQSTS